MKATRKIMTLVLAVVLTFSLAAPAFADVTGTNGLGKASSVKVTGTTKLPTINIVVPAGMAIVANPYGLKYKIEGVDDPVQDTLITANQIITNKSDINIMMTATVTGTTGGEVVFVGDSDYDDTNSKIKDTVTDKAAYMKVGIAYIGDGAIAVEDVKDYDISKIDAKASKIKGLVTVSAEEQDPFADDKGLVFAAATDDNGVITAGKETNAVIIIAGATNRPAGKDWTSSDKVGATLAFTFNTTTEDPGTKVDFAAGGGGGGGA